MNKRIADKTFPVPKSLHELFGRRTTKVELAIVLISCILLSSLLLFHAYDEWSDLAVWQEILLVILTLDITGGVVANVTKGTNEYYQTNHKARLVFLAVHVQPLILGWILGNLLLGTIIWIFSIITVLVITRIGERRLQRTAGMASALVGLSILMLLADTHLILNGLLALYILKLVFSFAVDHDGK
ncbi:hypothetical protein ACFOLA_00275 [Salinicoccus hispanicus]|uniref:Uncharacterized protein n=1 Tax=Salinicoccus hispanicus TaxID=157225 RepID=A0A6N8TYD0_9STAP|nr:hypothetical protein [Salinicoccus hispanicus]MXQ50017.1 hypothetical protein [Salinicoccus hispanicus]